MLPDIFNTKFEAIKAARKSFNDTLCDDYLFKIKSSEKNIGIRSVFYYREAHSLIISHLSSNRVHIVNLLTGKIRWFDHHYATVRDVLVCNNEIVSGSWDGTVCITNFETLQLRLVLTDKEMGRCPKVRISPDAMFAYSYSYDSDKNPEFTSNAIRKWALNNGALKNLIRLPGYHLGLQRFGSCTVVDDQIYVVSDSGCFQVFNIISGKMLEEYVFNEQLQTICEVPYYRTIIFGGDNGNLYQYDISARKITETIKGHECDIRDMHLSPYNHKLLFSVSFDGTLKIWEVPGLKLLADVEVNNNALWTLTIMEDLILTGGEEGGIWIYNIKDLSNITLKGRMVVFNESYACFSTCSEKFYTNDPALFQVCRKDDGIDIHGPFSEHLFNCANNFTVMQDLFNPKNEEGNPPFNDNKIMFQIPQSFS